MVVLKIMRKGPPAGVQKGEKKKLKEDVEGKTVSSEKGTPRERGR